MLVAVKWIFYFLDELPSTSLSRSVAASEEPSVTPEVSRAPQNQALIIITNIKGDVTYRVSANAPAQIGQNGVRLTEGTIVETGAGSSSVLLFFQRVDGYFIRKIQVLTSINLPKIRSTQRLKVLPMQLKNPVFPEQN